MVIRGWGMRERGDFKKVEWGLPGIRGEDHGSYF